MGQKTAQLDPEI